MLGYEVDWPLLEKWLPIFGPVITGMATLIVGIIVATVAVRQWQTARDKLAVDLFEKRFNAWTQWEEAFDLRRNTILTATRIRASRGDHGLEGIQELRKASNAAHLLFGPDIRSKMQDVTNALNSMTVEDVKEKAGRPSDYFNAANMVSDTYLAVHIAIRPYMMLDKIAVNRPSSPWWRRRRS